MNIGDAGAFGRLARIVAATSLTAAGAPVGASADVGVSAGATRNMTCAAGLCAPTATNAVLNVGDLEMLLASGNVTVTTTATAVQAGDLQVDAAVGWSDATALTLDSYHSIIVRYPLSVAGSGGLDLEPNDSGTDGRLAFGPNGRVSFTDLNDTLAISGVNYALVGSISALARAVSNNSFGSYALANEYDGGGDGIYSSSPVPIFNGHFEGLGNTISNLTISSTTELAAGLFAGLGQYGSINDLRLTALAVSGGETATVGGLVAVVYNGSLSGDSVGGTIAVGTSGIAGAMAGQLDGNVSYCTSAGHVRGGANASIGGPVGSAIPTDPTCEIVSSHASGSVTVAAGALYASIAGGLVGTDSATIANSSASATVKGGNVTWVGGLVAEYSGDELGNSYATGAVAGGKLSGVGGLLGTASGNIAASYSTGRLSARVESDTGGVVGQVGYGTTFAHTYWDTTTSGIANLNRGAGNVRREKGLRRLTTTQLQSALPPGFSPSVWGEDAKLNGGLPYLLANPPVK